MKSGLFRLAQQSGLYALGNLLLKVAGLALHKFYLDPDLLSSEEYGFLVLLETTAEFGILLAGLGLASGLLKFIADARYAADHDALPFTVLVLTAGSAALALGLFFLAAPLLSGWLLDDTARAPLVWAIGMYVVLKVVGLVPYTYLRAQEKVKWYVIALVAEWVLMVGGVAYLLGVREAGLPGVLQAWTLAAGASTLVLTGALLARSPWRLRLRLVPRLLRFGIPLALAGVASLTLKVGDQFLLEGLRDAATVGIYGWAYKISGVLNMLLVQSFQLAFSVVGLKRLGAGTGDTSLHRRVFRHFVIIGGWGALGLSLFAYDFTLFMTDNPDYVQAAPLVLPLALGFLGYGLYYVALNVLYSAEKTRTIGFNVTLSAAVNVALNLWLIPRFGAWGAAVATLLSYGLLAALTFWQAEQVMRAGYAGKVLLGVAVLLVVLYGAARFTLEWSTALRLGARIGLFLLYPVFVLVLRLYRWGELKEGFVWLKARIGGQGNG